MKQCPCCENYTIEEEFDICEVCYWEHDIIGESHPEKSFGANKVSLYKAQENYKKFGACEERFIKSIREPLSEELPENNV